MPPDCHNVCGAQVTTCPSHPHFSGAQQRCAMQAVARGPGLLALHRNALSDSLDRACSASSAGQSGAAACTPDTDHSRCCLQDSSNLQEEDVPAQLG